MKLLLLLATVLTLLLASTANAAPERMTRAEADTLLAAYSQVEPTLVVHHVKRAGRRVFRARVEWVLNADWTAIESVRLKKRRRALMLWSPIYGKWRVRIPRRKSGRAPTSRPLAMYPLVGARAALNRHKSSRRSNRGSVTIAQAQRTIKRYARYHGFTGEGFELVTDRCWQPTPRFVHCKTHREQAWFAPVEYDTFTAKRRQGKVALWSRQDRMWIWPYSLVRSEA